MTLYYMATPLPEGNQVFPKIAEVMSRPRYKPSTVEVVWENLVEKPFTWLGLADAAWKRGAFAAAATAGALWVWKPEPLFYRGQPRSMKLTSTDASATVAPWWLVSAAAGTLVYLFV